jgi:hypothetical protein
MKDLPGELVEAYEVMNRLAAVVLAQDSAAMLAELEKVAVSRKKVRATGGQA